MLLRMDKTTDYARPARKGPKRQRRAPLSTTRQPPPRPSTSSSGSPSPPPPDMTLKTETTNGQSPLQQSVQDHANHSDDDVDYQIRKNNAYPGSSNTIGSIHQRRWYLSMDRGNSGFKPTQVSVGDGRSKRVWVRAGDGSGLSGFEPFYVRGPDFERSVVTGRLGRDVFEDEGVEGFIGRKGWRAVLR